VSADIIPLLRVRAMQLLERKLHPDDIDASNAMRLAASEIDRLRAELANNRHELARLRERVTMLVEAAAEDAQRAARLERVITNKEPLL
jgi:hypothetical protein